MILLLLGDKVEFSAAPILNLVYNPVIPTAKGIDTR